MFRAGSFAERLNTCCLAAMTALLVAAPLVPSDAIPQLGTSVAVVMLWFVVLALWLLACTLRGSGGIRFGLTSGALLVLLALHLLSAMVLIVSGAGNGRAAINLLWRWTSFGVAFFLVRQMAWAPLRCRALCSVMVALALCLSTYGLFEYFYDMPKNRAAFQQQKTEQDKQRWLEQKGLPYYPPGSPERQHLEDRLLSVEPRGTFALANSLAGFLAPWLTVAVAIALVSWPDPTLRHGAVCAAAVCIAAAGFCLLLTKSRTGWIATALGSLALGMYVWFVGLRLSWKVLAVAAVALALMVVGAAQVGGIDWEVASEAAKSLSYRFEYWRATWSMIADHPWLGCGPGNFKMHYTLYKLPHASETVADPHNFLLEVWSTAGTPAMLALLAVFGGSAAQIWRAVGKRSGADLSESGCGGKGSVSPGAGAIYVGAAAGLVLAFPCGLLVGYAPSLAVLLVGAPAGAGCLILLHRWVQRGPMNLMIVLVPLLVLLVNLTAAGGISFAGIALSGWLLLGLALNVVEPERAAAPLARPVWAALLVLATGLAWACQQTALLPVIHGRSLIAEGDRQLKRGAWNAAARCYGEAARRDPFSPVPWQRRAWLALQRWQQGPLRSEEAFGQFQQLAEQYRRRDPNSSSACSEIGNWYLEAFGAEKKPEHLGKAIGYYEAAARLYPAGNIQHAQLAWAYHLAGDERAAAYEAEKAMRLDAMKPHREQKLRNQRVFDGRARPSGMDAEQLMRQLRKAQRCKNTRASGGRGPADHRWKPA